MLDERIKQRCLQGKSGWGRGGEGRGRAGAFRATGHRKVFLALYDPKFAFKMITIG